MLILTLQKLLQTYKKIVPVIDEHPDSLSAEYRRRHAELRLETFTKNRTGHLIPALHDTSGTDAGCFPSLLPASCLAVAMTGHVFLLSGTYGGNDDIGILPAGYTYQ
jgi:hypothetical protein